MKDDGIGARCQVCNLQDYVPYQCKKCKRKLCSNHYWEQSHLCRVDYNPPQPSIKQNDKTNNYYCSQCKVKLHTVTHYYCKDCQKLYCLKHRYPEQHKCQSDSCKLI